MNRNMEKTYDPATVETDIYNEWENKGYFSAKVNPDKKPFTIVIPPPNITGQLHMGHALDNTMQDIIIRYKRMAGFEALWLPGTDHASIATEVKLVEQLAEEGKDKNDIGREAFLDRAWDWKKEYGGRIVKQLRKMGSSCDWRRERFTMDEGCNKAVIEAFIDLYNKGLIYRGDRIINWCIDCKTALSDAEVDYSEHDSNLWHVHYRQKDGSDGIVVATTRPETILGDTAVAVNPKDERYANLIGKTLILPIVGRELPVVADDYVDMEFGTGAVKITPAHDPNDFEVAVRHGLPMIRVMDDAGIINKEGGKYCGMERYECRKKLVEDLQAGGHMVSIDDYQHNVGHCYRCNTVVEPIISKQWFVSMKPLAKPAIDAVRDGRIKFLPQRFEKIYFNWMENIRDWCISRQLWWGHRIPAYYCSGCGKTVVAKSLPQSCDCGCNEFHQDEDVLDTWFSSGLWPFSTLGWPEKTADLDYFYPTSVLVTGYDIIFFWVARMIVFGLAEMDEIPFSEVCVHGIVRDEQGRKMSKSLGNGIDPLEIIDKYGADALRFSLIVGTSAGNDMRFKWEKVEAARNFANKIWNASRFVLMNIEDGMEYRLDIRDAELADKWMLSRLTQISEEVAQNLDEYELGLGAGKLYDFIWNEFCDWYIEVCKSRLYGENEDKKKQAMAFLLHALEYILKLLHPYMPFLTEKVYSFLPNAEETIMCSNWPNKNKYSYPVEQQSMELFMSAIKEIRNVRAQMNVPPSKRTSLKIVAERDIAERIEETKPYIQKLGFADSISILQTADGISQNDISIVVPGMELYIPLEQLVDMEKEIERLRREIENLQKEILRGEGKLNNEGFVAKASPDVVEKERQKLEDNRNMLNKVQDRLSMMSAE